MAMLGAAARAPAPPVARDPVHLPPFPNFEAASAHMARSMKCKVLLPTAAFGPNTLLQCSNDQVHPTGLCIGHQGAARNPAVAASLVFLSPATWSTARLVDAAIDCIICDAAVRDDAVVCLDCRARVHASCAFHDRCFVCVTAARAEAPRAVPPAAPLAPAAVAPAFLNARAAPEDVAVVVAEPKAVAIPDPKVVAAPGGAVEPPGSLDSAASASLSDLRDLPGLSVIFSAPEYVVRGEDRCGQGFSTLISWQFSIAERRQLLANSPDRNDRVLALLDAYERLIRNTCLSAREDWPLFVRLYDALAMQQLRQTGTLSTSQVDSSLCLLARDMASDSVKKGGIQQRQPWRTFKNSKQQGGGPGAADSNSTPMGQAQATPAPAPAAAAAQPARRSDRPNKGVKRPAEDGKDGE